MRAASPTARAAGAVRALTLWASRPGPLRAAARPVATALRAALVRAADPVAPWRLGRFELDLPLSHDLPLHASSHPLYDTAVGRLAAALAAAHPERSIVDVGANVGDTAAMMRSSSPAALLCIEGDEGYYALLERNAARLGPAVELDRCLVGPSRGVIAGALVASRGTASVSAACSGARLELEPLDAVLARHPGLPPPKLVKIDTDGFDCPIVEGSMDVWRRFRPVLFFEYDPAFYATWDPFPMFEALHGAGYRRALVYEHTGEYAGCASLADRIAIDDLHRRYAGWRHARYADLCVFHGEDELLAERFRREELVAARRA